MKRKIIKREKIMLAFILILIVLVFADFFLTLVGIEKLGIESEGNLIVRNLLENNKIILWFLMKAIPSIILLLCVLFIMWLGGDDIKNIVYFIISFFGVLIMLFIIINLAWVIKLL